MNKVIGSLLTQFREFYKGLTPTKRMSLLIASVLLAVTGVIAVVMFSGAEYQVLLANVPAEQLPTVVEKLQSRNIKFQLKDEGKTILVPSVLLHSTQMMIMEELGSQNVGHIGLELFDRQDFGTTTYAQKINFQRAMQGELMRAINTLSAVKQSKVILALPNKKTFLEESDPPTASVVVELRHGKTLSTDQVRGITNLVSSSVEGLTPERVTVVDSVGRVLSRNLSPESAAASDLQDMKKKMEEGFENRIETILSRVLGTGKVIARVNVSLNSRATTTVEETVDPDKTAIRSAQTEEESLAGARTNPTGVPGARANLPGAEDTGQVGFNQNVKKELKTTNYAVPKTVKNVRENPGSIERLTVAVLVDGVTAYQTKEGEAPTETWTPRTPEEMAKFESIVKNAVGFQEQRGDSIKIENIKFEKEDFTASDRELGALMRRRLLYSLFKWGSLSLIVAMFFLLVVRPFMRWITDSFQDSVEDMLPRTIEELEDLQTGDNSLPGMGGVLPVLDEAIDPDKAESELLRERIINLMEKDQEKAAGAFSLWLVRKDH